MLLKSTKVLRKNLRTNIKRTNIKKKLKYTLEYKEFRQEVKELC
jgi:hypothetical protein